MDGELVYCTGSICAVSSDSWPCMRRPALEEEGIDVVREADDIPDAFMLRFLTPGPDQM